MYPRDAWLLEKLDEMRAQRKAAAFGRRHRFKSPKERLNRFRKNGLATRLDFSKEVAKMNRANVWGYCFACGKPLTTDMVKDEDWFYIRYPGEGYPICSTCNETDWDETDEEVVK